MTRRRSVLFRLAAVLLGTLLGLLAAELSLRGYAQWRRAELRAAWRRSGASLPPPYRGRCDGVSQATLGQLIQPSTDPDIIYELKPNLDTCYYGARVQTNAQGLRARREYRRPKPAGVHRILLLGDSQTFGQGVELEATFGAKIEAALSERTERRVEVINTGVDGYNGHQEVAHLASYGMSYEPDCVLLLFVANDLELPGFVWDPRFSSAGSRLLLLSLLRQWWLGRDGARDASPLVGRENDGFQPAARGLEHMAGARAYARAIRQLKQVACDVPVVAFNSHQMPVRLRSRLGPEILFPDVRIPWAPEYWLSDENRHLNPAGHQELAVRMLAALTDLGVCMP